VSTGKKKTPGRRRPAGSSGVSYLSTGEAKDNAEQARMASLFNKLSQPKSEKTNG